MTVYLINYFLIIIAYYSVSPRTIGMVQENQFDALPFARSKRVCVVAAINAIILSTFRDWSVGADTRSYLYTFNEINNYSWEKILGLFNEKYVIGSFDGDPGYYLVTKVFQCFSTNYQWWLLFMAVAFTVPFAFFVMKYSSDALISWVMYFALFFGFFGTTGMRQTLACSVAFFVSLPLIKEKKIIYFIISVILASTLHHSCLIFLPMFFISKVKFNRVINYIYWVLIILAFIAKDKVFAIMNAVGANGKYGYYEGAGAPTFTFFLLCISILLTLFREKIVDNKEFSINFSAHATMLAMMFSPLLLIDPSLMRIVMYFSFFLIILLPEFTNIFTEKSKGIFKVIVIVVLMFLALRTSEYQFGEFLLF